MSRLFLYTVSRIRYSITKYRGDHGDYRGDGRYSTRHKNQFSLRNVSANIISHLLSFEMLSLAFASISNTVYCIFTEMNSDKSCILMDFDESYETLGFSDSFIFRISLETRDPSYPWDVRTKCFSARVIFRMIQDRKVIEAQVLAAKYVTRWLAKVVTHHLLLVNSAQLALRQRLALYDDLSAHENTREYFRLRNRCYVTLAR